MFLDENHQRALQGYSGRSNTSSMKGAGVTVVAEVRPGAGLLCSGLCR
jgi:hypothetical protein